MFGTGLSSEAAAHLASILNRFRDRPTELKPYGDEHDEFVVQLRNIAHILGVGQDASVIYPGSNTHAGVARAFGRENVTHVDPDGHATNAMRKAGYHTAQLPIEEYIPEHPADLVVALNSYGQPTREVMNKLVVPEGYVIANNWTGWAHDLTGMTGYAMVGAILPAYNSPEAEWVDAADLPNNPAGKEIVFYKILPGGALSAGTLEDNTFADEEYHNPDALFVFQRQLI